MEFKRLFTRLEAESALPLVRQIVGDVLDAARKIRERDENDSELPWYHPIDEGFQGRRPLPRTSHVE